MLWYVLYPQVCYLGSLTRCSLYCVVAVVVRYATANPTVVTVVTCHRPPTSASPCMLHGFFDVVCCHFACYKVLTHLFMDLLPLLWFLLFTCVCCTGSSPCAFLASTGGARCTCCLTNLRCYRDFYASCGGYVSTNGLCRYLLYPHACCVDSLIQCWTVSVVVGRCAVVSNFTCGAGCTCCVDC